MPAQVRFLLGRAGSGKTHFIKGELAALGRELKRAILLVPEQFTFETERALAAELGGLLGIQVLSFGRLSERVAAADAREHLSAQGRRMIVRRAVHKEYSNLTVFSAVARRAGFAAHMDALFTKCRQFLITPDMLQAAAEALPAGDALSGKLRDIAILYRATQEYLDEHYLDSEGAQRAMIGRIPSSMLRGADVYIDGFELLTEQLYEILQSLMLAANSLTITLCLDPEKHAPDAALFAPERAAYERLSALAYSIGCVVKTVELPAYPWNRHPELIHLEKFLYVYTAKPYEGKLEAVSLLGAVDRASEVEALSDAVTEAARSGIRYRDMAVIASDLNAYADLVTRAFARRNIPLFMDARRSMQGHPSVELMLSAARAATGGFPRAELLRILKTDLAGVTFDGAEAFENYALRRGLLGGKAFLSPFPPEEEAAECARRTLIEPLLRLKAGMENKKAGEKTRALYGYLTDLHVERQLLENVERLRLENRFDLMEEHAQVWDVLMQLFEQLYAILGEADMGRQEYIEVLTEALSAYQVGVIPATADQVLFGDLNRTRSREVRALFLLGCNEGLLPAPRMDEEIIDDGELNALSQMGLAPWGGTAYRAQLDRLSIYRALSCASERLWFGFSYSDGKRELLSASLIDRVRELFPNCVEQSTAAQALPQSPQSGFLQLLQNLKAADPLHAALRAYFAEDSFYFARLSQAEAFAREPTVPPSFGAPLARKLYGKRVFSTVSRLETFRTCPFQHFAQYGLKALPRREYKEKKSDIGSFSHMALEAFVREAQRRYDWGSITREDCEALLDEILPDCLSRYQDGMLVATPRARALSSFYIAAVRETAWALSESFKKGGFRPVGLELRFGPDEALPPVTVPLPDGGELLLSGAIDRVDAAEQNGERLVRVVDYKTGDRSFSYESIADGLKLQLPVYLAAAIKAENASPAGAFYQPVLDPAADEGGEDKLQKKMRLIGVLRRDEEILSATERALSGISEVVEGLQRKADASVREHARLLSAEEMQKLLSFAVKRTGEIAAELISGRVAAAPVKMGKSTACAYCDYKSVCRFDARLPNCRVRDIKKCGKQEFFEKLTTPE
ncbi:MAG TPA: PD-(D/E)XK nuclease family protein [Feifaniaceae bacterium]|nr:PD-(D/E)XK nuclease family protein [Feifaniaceae bacterium]